MRFADIFVSGFACNHWLFCKECGDWFLQDECTVESDLRSDVELLPTFERMQIYVPYRLKDAPSGRQDRLGDEARLVLLQHEVFSQMELRVSLCNCELFVHESSNPHS